MGGAAAAAPEPGGGVLIRRGAYRSLDWLALHQRARAHGWRVVYRDARLRLIPTDWDYVALSDDGQVRALVPVGGQ